MKKYKKKDLQKENYSSEDPDKDVKKERFNFIINYIIKNKLLFFLLFLLLLGLFYYITKPE